MCLDHLKMQQIPNCFLKKMVFPNPIILSPVQDRKTGFHKNVRAHVRGELVCMTLKPKCLGLKVMLMVGDINSLSEGEEHAGCLLF
jgi:hypothetical protein